MELGKILLDKREIKEERELSGFELAILRDVLGEIRRIYWNHYQEELSAYLTDEDEDNVFSKEGIVWRNYDWSEEPSSDPNLVINNTNFWMYKYFGRGMTTDRTEKLDENWHNQCIDILNKIEKNEN